MSKNDARSLESYIKKFVDDSSNHLKPFVVQGRLNNDFIRGRQHHRVNKRNLRIEESPPQSQVYQEKKIFNRMLPIYLTRYGILTQNMPIPGIKPVGNTSKEVNDARVVNHFVRHIMKRSNFKTKYQSSVKHGDVYGVAWFKTGIDWSAGDEVAEIETTVNDVKGKMTLKEGYVFASFVPMYEVFVDNLHIESMDDVNELVHRRAFSLDYIRKRWGIEAKRENITMSNLPTFPRYSNLGFQNAGDIEYAYVYEYYKKPDAMYPQGRYVIQINDKTVWDHKLPYMNKANGKRGIPFDFVNLQSIPEHLIGVTVYSQLIPIQQTYNAMRNRYLEYVNHIAIGQIYYWEGSLINKKNFTTRPGKLVGLKRNARKPEIVQKDKLSMEFMNSLRDLKEDMLEASGLSQMAAYGTTKSNVRTDGVVDKLTESDDNKLVNALDSISESLVKVFKKIVYLEKERQNYLYEKLKIAKVKPTFQYDLSDVDAENLTIVNREFLMQSDQKIEAKIAQATGAGLYAPDTHMSYRSKLEYLNAMNATYLVDTLDPMERATHDLCDEENTLLLEGKEFPQVETYHTHSQHITEHTLFRMSAEVRQLRADDPKKYKVLQEAIDEHVAAHQQHIDASQEENVYNEEAKAAMDTTFQGQGPKRTA